MSKDQNQVTGVRHPRAASRGIVLSARGLPLLMLLYVGIQGEALFGQTSAPAGSAGSDARRMAEIEHRLTAVTDALVQTQQTLRDSLAEIQRLRTQLDAMRAGDSPKAAGEAASDRDSAAAGQLAGAVQALREDQEAMQAEIKQHEQIKVETGSKYPLRVTGLILFNAFSNVGVVDDAELPAFALPRLPGALHGSNGASLRQTLVGLEANGPRIADARTSGEVNIDFFGGVASNAFGYTASTGLVRLRQARIDLDWSNTTAEFGYTGPLISPWSPTSYATVAQPAMTASGNLWTWSPQLRIEQRLPLSEQRDIALEGGLIYPQTPGYTSDQLVSPIGASRHPGLEGRLSYRAGLNAAETGRHLVFGLGGYSADQDYGLNTRIHAWAVTGDWKAPIAKWIDLSGEVYRGRALGGLGGGAYKDVLTGTDAITGLPRTVGVDAIGGWSQLKLRFAPTLEANAVYGLDDAFGRNFEELTLPPNTNPFGYYARNTSVMGNLIFRPKTYLIISPEYRRVVTWPYTGAAYVANIFTVSAGYQF